MLVEIKVPQLAESVTEASLVNWHKRQGDYVKRGENLIDIETDKVVLEVTAPQDGVLQEIRKGDGNDVGSDEVIALIETEVAPEQGAPPSVWPDATGEMREFPRKPSADVAGTYHVAVEGNSQQGAAPATEQAAPPHRSPDLRTSPAARRLLTEHGLNAHEVVSDGNDRVRSEDVLNYIDRQHQDSAGSTSKTPAVHQDTSRAEKRVPMTRLRKRVAERLLQAQSNAAILSTFNEINLASAAELRGRHKDAFEARHGVRLGYMSFFITAAVEALKRHPIINARVDGDDIVYHDFYDIGIAVASPRGLVVPILRDADRLSFSRIETAIQEFGQKAKDNSLDLQDLSGGTFTITNGGVFGSLLSTPILNPPQSAILGMHTIQQRPVAENGAVVIRPMMYVALSYDHRIIDGKDAVQFLVDIKQMIEDPSRLLLNV